MSGKKLLSNDGLRKIAPRLRMICDGDAVVNLLRSERCAALRARSRNVAERISQKIQQAQQPYGRQLVAEHPEAIARPMPAETAAPPAAPPEKAPLPQLAPPLRPDSLERITDEIEVNVFLGLREDVALDDFPYRINRKGTLAFACVPLHRLDELAAHPAVSHIEMGEALKPPLPQITRRQTAGDSGEAGRIGKTARRGEMPAGAREGTADSVEAIENSLQPDPRAVETEAPHRGGEGVLVGLIDVEGFDFTHPDFQDPSGGGTRFERIWDQGAEGARSHPGQRPYFDYGSEFRKAQLDAAIGAAAQLAVPAWEIERQSQRVVSSHGTHVASIAAGNAGVCPRAKIAAVLISLPQADQDRRLSFSDSSRIAHAVEYLFALKDELGCKAVSINISLGTNGHAHDGSSAVNRWIDTELAIPGRSVCIAAGNAGQEAPTGEDDLGFVMGRIHTSGRIAAAGLSKDIAFQVVGNTIEDISENELELWYSPQDRFAISVRPPGSASTTSHTSTTSWIGPIEPGAFLENHQLADGTFISIYNETYHPSNGNNYIAMYLSPFFGADTVRGVRPGVWTVRLHGREVRDGRYHGWIERDDPAPVVQLGPLQLWSFPSFFTPQSNVDESSIGSLACGRFVIAVANLDERIDAINISSSQGPTRDGRHKPEVGAPGTDIVAASGFDDESTWVGMTGTSMASPYVAGVIGLMLAVEPALTAVQIAGIIERTAQPLPGSDFTWKNDAGYGVINAVASVEEAARVNPLQEILP